MTIIATCHCSSVKANNWYFCDMVKPEGKHLVCFVILICRSRYTNYQLVLYDKLVNCLCLLSKSKTSSEISCFSFYLGSYQEASILLQVGNILGCEVTFTGCQ